MSVSDLSWNAATSEAAAALFEPKPRKWATPGALGMALDPAVRTSPALDLINAELAELTSGHAAHNALGVFMPPQEGKSQTVSRRLPEWLLSHDPSLRIGIVSYEQDMAVRWGREIKRDVAMHPELGITIRADSSAAGRWDTPDGGGVYCAGIGGPLTGRALDCLRGETAILTEYGYYSIRDIHQSGAYCRVLSFNHGTGRAEWKRITASRAIPDRELVEVITGSGLRIICTPDHRIWTDCGYVAAADLRPGMGLVTAAGGPGAVRPLRGHVHEEPVDDLAGKTGHAAALQQGLPVRSRSRRHDLRPLRRGLHQAALRGGQGAGQGIRPVVLLEGLLAGRDVGDTCSRAPLRGLRHLRTEPPRHVLLGGMPPSGIPGFRHLLAMRDHVRVAERRSAKEDPERPDQLLLLTLLHGHRAPRKAAQRGRSLHYFPSVRMVLNSNGAREEEQQVLLAGVHEGCAESGASPEKDEAVPAMRRGVRLLQRATAVLHAHLRQRRARAADDRARQLPLQGRHELRDLVPADAPADPPTRRPRLPGLPCTGQARPSHRSPALAQLAGEPDHALPDLPCGAPQVGTDTVSVVRGLRGERDTVYDLQVEGNRNFFAGEILVHNCLIIDDPVKDRAAAESETIRRSAWDWWESVALTRLAPRGVVLLCQTRWHESDLAGMILTQPGPLRWRTVTIPAIAAGHDDPLGRAPGEELVSVRGRERGYFHGQQAGMSPYVFSSIYQQSPSAAEGNFFRRATFRYWRPSPSWNDGRETIDCEGRTITLADAWIFATMDVAASTKTTSDYTVVAVWAMSVEGDLILLDRRRKQVAEHDHFALFEPLRLRWDITQLYVERGFFASTMVTDARAAGVPVAEVVADTDKITRAIPAAGRLHAGRVWFPAQTSGCECGNCPDGVWLDEWADELASFNRGAHDDQVDVFSYAARIATAEWVPARTEPRRGLSDYDRAVATAAASAGTDDGWGSDGGGVDFMAAQW